MTVNQSDLRQTQMTKTQQSKYTKKTKEKTN